jgi:hypothetical protein
MVERTINYFGQFKAEEFTVRLEIIKLTYLYYKHDSVYRKIHERIRAKGENIDEKIKKFFLVEDS